MPRPPHVAASALGLSDRVFSELVAKARAQGGHIHPLHVGDTYLEPPPFARAEAQHVSATARLHNYGSVHGEPRLLHAIVEHLKRLADIDVAETCIQVTSGGTSGLSVVCSTLLAQGDEVILPAPFWPLIRGIVASRGATAVEVPFFSELERSDVDPVASIERAITEKSVALYLNSPNNPTGRVVPPYVVDGLLALAVKHNLWVITDEAYEELWYDDEKPSPIWARPEVRDRVIAAHTLSKGFAMAGARVGFVHGPAEFMAQLRGVQTFNVYSAARPMQLAAANALTRGREWAEHVRLLYRDAAHKAADALNLPRPSGGTFLFFDAAPHMPEGATSSMPFLLRCLEEGVLLTPGSASGRAYERYARLCYTCVAPAELDDALRAVRRAMSSATY